MPNNKFPQHSYPCIYYPVHSFLSELLRKSRQETPIHGKNNVEYTIAADFTSFRKKNSQNSALFPDLSKTKWRQTNVAMIYGTSCKAYGISEQTQGVTTHAERIAFRQFITNYIQARKYATLQAHHQFYLDNESKEIIKEYYDIRTK